MRSPVLFLIFNRPDVTARVFEAIRAAQPPRLYLAADGPRAGRPDEAERCAQTRALASAVDWPCEVHTLFRPENLGCKRGVSSGITWFFEHEPEGIVLEDDCLPSPMFFSYCDALLERYRHDERVGLISGTALIDLRAHQLVTGDEDYVFNRYPSIWGWASWRRVWRDYDVDLVQWPRHRLTVLSSISNPAMRRACQRIVDRVAAGLNDTWDYQLGAALWASGRVSIAPRFNLIENIGFGPDATHTTSAHHPMAAKARLHDGTLSFPLRAPDVFVANPAYQAWIERDATRGLVSRALAVVQQSGITGFVALIASRLKRRLRG